MEFGKVIQWTTDIAQGPVRDVFTQWGHLIAITAACVAIALFIKKAGGYSFGRKPAQKFTLDKYPPSSPFTGKRIDYIDPTTGDALGSENGATEAEVNECVAKAAIAQKEWSKTSFAERRAVLRDLMEAILANADEIVKSSCKGTALEARMGEILNTCEKLRYLINFAEGYLQPEKRHIPMMLAHRNCTVEYKPLGVIGAIVPWNYPFHNAVGPVAVALMTGNSIVVKWSEFGAVGRNMIQELLNSVLRARGHSTDLVQFVPGYGDAGAALVQCPQIAKILFIGSPATGRKVMQSAVKNLTPVILELGGKDPFIVMEDAELDYAVQLACRGSFINLGQNCISAERTFVHRKIYDKFTNKVVETMKTWRLGVDCGAMTMPLQVQKVDDLIDDAVKRGAKILLGGKSKGGKTLIHEPTILADIHPDSRILHEEIFGPVMCLIPFDTEDELIKRANSIEFGLCCSVISSNVKRAEALARKIESGMAVVNEFGLAFLAQDAPFGGVKQSGFGCFNGPEGIRGFCHAHPIHSEKFWMPTSLKVPAFVSNPWMDISPAIIKHSTEILFGWGIGAKTSAVFKIIKVLLTGNKKSE